MAKKTPEVFSREFFVKKGREGGKLGGKRRLETMTPEERSERAKKAVAARKWHAVKPKPDPRDVVVKKRPALAATKKAATKKAATKRKPPARQS